MKFETNPITMIIHGQGSYNLISKRSKKKDDKKKWSIIINWPGQGSFSYNLISKRSKKKDGKKEMFNNYDLTWARKHLPIWFWKEVKRKMTKRNVQ